MKLQKLTIHNLASIEDAVIDFEAQPLADSEVFLITGKTGAGKSMILDAICLALYANTPRLANTSMQGETQDGDKTMRLSDTRQMMRRNTAEASVSLTFTGSNGVRYEAIWSVARARKKVTGNIQGKSWSLTNLDRGHTLDKDNDIRAEIQAAVGLDFGQFCRTTLLAQGEFTRFLNSRDDDKAAILEKITGVDIYARLGRKVYEVTDGKQKAWDDAKRLTEGIRTMSDEQVAVMKDELTSLNKEYEGIRQAGEVCRRKQAWLKTDAELEKRIAECTAAYDQAKARVECEEYKERERLIQEWNSTIDARQHLKTKQAAAKEIEQQEKTLAELQNTAGALQERLQQAEAEKKASDEACALLEKQIKEQEATLAALQMEHMRLQRDETKEMLAAIVLAKRYLQILDAERVRRQQAAQEIADRQAIIADKRNESNRLDVPIREAEIGMNTAQEMLEKQKDTVDKFALTLRQKLHVGDVCPVCRQTILSPLPHEDELKQLVDGLRETFSEKEKAYNELRNRKNTLEAEIKAAEQTNSMAQAKYANDRSVEQAEQQALKQIGLCGIETIDEQTIGRLDSLNELKSKQLRDLDEKILKGEEQDKAIRGLRAAQDKQRKQAEAQQQSCMQAQNALTEHAGRTKMAHEQLHKAQEQMLASRMFVDSFCQQSDGITIERLTELDRLTAQNIADMRSILEREKNNVLTQQTLLEAAKNSKQQHLDSKPDLTEDDTPEQLAASIETLDRRLAEVAEKKGAIQQELRTDEDNRKRLGQLIEDAESKAAEFRKWSRLNELVGDATGNKFRRIAQSYVLNSLIHSANRYMSTLSDRYTLKVEPGTFVISLEDAYHGYMSRAASTISGGESFLVSLSLALALSDIGQQLAVDTLFIDEGFGTLSDEPLQNAINTLRSLHNKSGRHVGIISHIEELSERVPVQIRVEQNPQASSSTVRVVPEVK